MVGGSSDPSVPWSPGVTLQEKAGRPIGPSTLRCEYLWEVVVVYVGLLFWLCSFLFVLCEAVVISQGSVFVFGPLSPSRPDPCLLFNCLSSFVFFLCLVFSSTPCLSLSLSLSGAGETQTFWFGFPLVFLRPARALRHRSVHLPLHLHQGHLPHLFFFSFVVVARLPAWCFFLVLVLSVLVVLVCVFVPGLGSCWVAALHYRPRIF